jgi:3,4-dihydroxy 2-butanone 4-phosphate synthase / GTP cyclohydrolase II
VLAGTGDDTGHLVATAGLVTERHIAFVVRHTTGIICSPMPETRADELLLPPMVAAHANAPATAFTVSVEAVEGGSGGSAGARARTLNALGDVRLRADELRRPGHVFPIRARRGGVLIQPGAAEAVVDLLTMAGMPNVGVSAEMTDDEGALLRGAQVHDFAAMHGLPMLAVADLVKYRRATERVVESFASARMPTEFGLFQAVGYRNVLDASEHLAVVMGDLFAAGQDEDGVLAHVHSECAAGDIFESVQCRCRTDLEYALKKVAEEGRGVVVYLRDAGDRLGRALRSHDPRGSDLGQDHVDCARLLAHRTPFDVGCHILSDLGVRNVRLITGSRAEAAILEDCGIRLVSALPPQSTDGTPRETARCPRPSRAGRDA